MRFLILTALVAILAFPAWGYHEFKTPKKAFKKVTIEYYSDESKKTSPDSTVTIYYDKNDVEMHREVKKGCGNPVAEAWGWDMDSLLVDTTNVIDLYGIQGYLTPAILGDSLLTILGEYEGDAKPIIDDFYNEFDD